jgi:hypothetical protein
MSTTIDEYREKLFAWQWRYAGAMQFDGALDPAYTAALGSPVFRQGASAANVLLRPDDDQLMRTRVVGQVATRRRSFRSMASSQALAQSVFGNLAARARLGCLAGLADEAGRPLFFESEAALGDAFLDQDVAGLLGEPDPAVVDVWIAAPHRVVVGCTLAEAGIAGCVCPELDPDDTKYCNRLFRTDAGRSVGCSLSEHGDADYWRYLPKLLGWRPSDGEACPLASTLQLVRDVLAACVLNGELDCEHGHAVLVVDSRNPTFAWSEWRPAGAGAQAFEAVRDALGVNSHLLRLCTWQRITKAISAAGDLDWLVRGLKQKYGIEPDAS